MPKSKKNKKEKPYRTFTFEAERTIFLEVEARTWEEAKERAVAQLDEMLLEYFKDDGSVEEFFGWEQAENAEAPLPPKCPKCGKEIHDLKHYPKGYAVYTFTIGKSGNAIDQYEDFQIIDDPDDDEYVCPECDEKIFTTAKEAEEFLRWGKVAIRPE